MLIQFPPACQEVIAYILARAPNREPPYTDEIIATLFQALPK